MSVAASPAGGPSPTAAAQRRAQLAGISHPTLVVLLAASIACTGRTGAPAGVTVNDVQSQLNSTLVHDVATPASIPEIREIIRRARTEGLAVSITGGRHAMGGQQFGSGTILMDMSRMNRVLRFDSDKGIIEAEAGIQWPALLDYLLETQKGRARQWGIIQKQTGADNLSLGGALSANVHGRGLNLKPIIGDVESFTLVDANGEVRRCSRQQDAELFRLVIGGYGLFGVIAQVELRLAPRRKVQRIVEVIDLENLISSFQKRTEAGFQYGDFQYATDPDSDDFLRKGVFSCYRPVGDETPIPENQKELSADDWAGLYFLSHTQKTQAFERYSSYYLSTSGQVYWSDTNQLALYLENYHQALDARLGGEKGTEMITEIYVPRASLASFMTDVRADLRRDKASVIYGTIRLIEKDDESFLAWARQPWVCIIFNLHVVHTQEGLEAAAKDFRRLIDLAIRYEGSYYLTYHRWATREQVERCHPRFVEFLRLKKRYDPEERFQSDWYRHYRDLFAGASSPVTGQ
ncbi:MAG TPA: FAD-binding oxidoreductase [Candidatus Polarisedimenticolia bacterium]|jgi:FAD/FMN-containing dehydrogenase